MRWSKLKVRLEERLPPSLQGRLHFHASRYPHVCRWCMAVSLRLDKSLIDVFPPCLQFPSPSVLGLESSVSGTQLFASLSMGVDEMLEHDEPVYRGLAVLDARLGMRRLLALDTSNETAFARWAHALRLEAAGRLPPGGHRPSEVLALAQASLAASRPLVKLP